MRKIRELKVKPIKNGTVIDHIPAGRALQVLKILKIPEGKNKVTIGINMESSRMGIKDIVKIENRELHSEEVDQIALIAPKATINIIRDYEVVKKEKVQLRDEIEGLIKCPNPNCISNADEPIKTKFYVVDKEPVTLRCYYCERLIKEEEIKFLF
ncbi:aspartate carbamoyltransferase, regulatory subunit [Methanothermus fervidus DSM 2088]|uniref:Aspartate carbamoyltransferase regulatory chain n=1 Tax=Methanothermus fervidus (strain ATCC 43054 / DSM 2088 / JCM 10308 / V24 S) TaxID=523846 RepID=E3GWI8_METFV|nr:aspartate carbamoyltransferase regulatory subunit [Methanothermus fervidus]ADP77953.1 aspartate carbamoyltransferase, regulatory subunit [Methanothermus fervidus DSM 2088]